MNKLPKDAVECPVAPEEFGKLNASKPTNADVASIPGVRTTYDEAGVPTFNLSGRKQVGALMELRRDYGRKAASIGQHLCAHVEPFVNEKQARARSRSRITIVLDGLANERPWFACGHYGERGATCCPWGCE